MLNNNINHKSTQPITSVAVYLLVAVGRAWKNLGLFATHVGHTVGLSMRTVLGEISGCPFAQLQLCLSNERRIAWW